jgi:hypothetical protein
MTSEELGRTVVMVGWQGPLEWIWLRGQFPIPNLSLRTLGFSQRLIAITGKIR